MKKIKAIIEKADDGGISIYSEDVNGAYGFGFTEQEAKDDFVSVLEEQAKYYNEKHGSWKRTLMWKFISLNRKVSLKMSHIVYVGSGY